MTLDKRIGSLCIVLALMVLGIVVTFDSLAAIRVQRQDLALLDQRTRALEARADALNEASPGAAGAAPGPEGWGLVGTTSGLASAEFQRSFATLAERAGALVRTLDMRESDVLGEPDEASGRQLVRLRLEADIEVVEQTLPDLLYAIETGQPLMVIESVTLRPNRTAFGPGNPGFGPQSDRPLNLRLAVAAFWTTGDAR